MPWHRRIVAKPLRRAKNQAVSSQPLRPSMAQAVSRQPLRPSMVQAVSLQPLRCAMTQVISRQPLRRAMVQAVSLQPLRCAMTQAVICRIPCAEARVQIKASSYGICGGQSGTDRIFSQYFDFLLSVPFHQCSMFIHSSPSPYNRSK